MVEMPDRNMSVYKITSRLRSPVVIGVAASVFGAACALVYARNAWSGTENKGNVPISEIVVSSDKGLLFRSEDGTPLLRVGKDGFGTHVRLLSPSGAPLVELNTVQGTGGITVSSKNGGYAYVQAQEESATITLIGKYNKEAVEMTSATKDGGGNLFINEGSQGYHAVEIGAGPNRVNSKGTITIKGENGAGWLAP